MASNKKLLILPGDGIGPEVMREVRRVIDWMARKRAIPPSLGTFPTTGPLWVGLLIGTIVLVGALTYFPALALGPIVEQLLLHAGRLF